MKNFLLLLVLIGCTQSFATSRITADTISYWHVTLDDKLIGDFNVANKDSKVVLPNKITNPNLIIQYFDDTPCPSCMNTLYIKNELGGTLARYMNRDGSYLYNISTDKLKQMAVDVKVNSLYFHFQEGEKGETVFLFSLHFKQ